VTWDEALSDIAARLQAIIAREGPTAILPYSYAGSQGLLQGLGPAQGFFERVGATRLARDICASTGSAGIAATLGTNTTMLPHDILHSRLIIFWGANPIVTNLHLWPLVREAKANGATVVVIDPVKTRSAASADWHVQPLPGTDAALALGMMHVIVAEGLHDADYIAQHTVGFEQLQERLAEYPPDRVAEITGLPAEEIVALARAYATTQPAVIRLMVGMEHRAHGAMAYRSIACLPALTGAWRHRGGGILYLTSALQFGVLNAGDVLAPEPKDRAIREINMVQLGRALTDPALDPPLKALIVWSSNPATIAPNQQLVQQGLRRDDLFTVVHEQFLTDTARHADYVLPATTQLEHLDLMWSWGHQYVALNRPAIAPLGEAVPTTEFFRRLATRMGHTGPAVCQTDEDLVRLALASDHPYLCGVTFERLWQEGWAPLNLPPDWRPFADGHFPTPSGKCELWSETLAAEGYDPLPTYEPAPESLTGNARLAARYPLTLVTAKSALHFLNSSYANLPRNLRSEGEPLLDLHPADAACRGIADGECVRVFNDRGEVQLRVRLGDRVRPGVAAMPSGWWASLSPGGSSANSLTADGISDRGGGGDFHDTLVEVAPVEH
jgi:anaerobic selenocysteine-containing dehydrogenase